MKKNSGATVSFVLETASIVCASLAMGAIGILHIKHMYSNAVNKAKAEKKRSAVIHDISAKEIKVVAEAPIYADEYISAVADSRNVDEKPSEEEEEAVFVTEKGKKYHENRYCAYLKNSGEVREISLSEAENDGLKPCVKCCSK